MMKLFNFSPKDHLNEVIFENRNKNYGAYILRTEEGNILQKALFFGVAAFLTVAVIPLAINAYNQSKLVDDGITDYLPPHVLVDVEKQDIKKPDVVKIEPLPKNDVKIVQSQVPTPTKDPVVEKTIAKKSDMKDAVLGFAEKDGKETSKHVVIPTVDVPKGPTVDYVKPAEVIPVDDNVIVAKPDVEAKFPGGIDAFRNQVGKYFNQSDFDGTGELMRTTVTFVVEKDGTISNIKAAGNDSYFNKEAVKTVNMIKGKWIPAKVNGKNVRYAFKMPIAMQFD